jgi:hypothetical protein
VSSLFLLLPSVVPCPAEPLLSPSFHPYSFVSDSSLGASWAFSFQQTLLLDKSTLAPISRREFGPGLSRRHLNSAVKLGRSVTDSMGRRNILRGRQKLKSFASVESDGALPWLGFDRVQLDRSVL